MIDRDQVDGGADDARTGADTGSPGAERDAAESSDRRSAAEEVERELVLMFRRARNLSTVVAAHVHPDLDPASYSLLLMIDEMGPMRGMDVVERIGLDKSTVSRQIATLVQLDLLERVPDPDDGRARRVRLSELGRERLAQVRGERSKHLRTEFAAWSTEDLTTLARLLSRLNDMM